MTRAVLHLQQQQQQQYWSTSRININWGIKTDDHLKKTKWGLWGECEKKPFNHFNTISMRWNLYAFRYANFSWMISRSTDFERSNFTITFRNVHYLSWIKASICAMLFFAVGERERFTWVTFVFVHSFTVELIFLLRLHTFVLNIKAVLTTPISILCCILFIVFTLF